VQQERGRQNKTEFVDFLIGVMVKVMPGQIICTR
jgi:hypothetical protein